MSIKEIQIDEEEGLKFRLSDRNEADEWLLEIQDLDEGCGEVKLGNGQLVIDMSQGPEG